MTTSAKCGMSGSITGISGSEITNWSITLDQDIPEVTSMASTNGFREYLPCLKSASGSFDSFTSIGVIGTVVGLSFINAIETIGFSGIITSVAVGTPVDGAVTFKYSVDSTGVITVS